MRFWQITLKLFIPLIGLLIMSGCNATESPIITVTLDHDENSATELLFNDGRAIIDVNDPRGINGLTATLEEGDWLEEIILRLNLKGLEQLEILYGNITLSTGASSSGARNLPLMLSVTDERGRVQTVSPPADIYYPAISRMGGGFEITLPTHFFQAKHAAFSVRWINFYR